MRFAMLAILIGFISLHAQEAKITLKNGAINIGKIDKIQRSELKIITDDAPVPLSISYNVIKSIEVEDVVISGEITQEGIRSKLKSLDTKETQASKTYISSAKADAGKAGPQKSSAASKFCPKCGVQNQQNNNFCTSCGQSFSLQSGTYYSKRAPQFGYEEDMAARDFRKIGISLNLGWNSLAGLGLQGIYFIKPQVALDGALGLGGSGYKLGGRGRYLFSENNFSPYLGMGLLYSTGTPELEIEDQYNNDRLVRFKLKPAALLQMVGGLEFVAMGGFLFGCELGYAKMFGDNVQIVSGNPSSQLNTVFDIAYGGGIVIGLNFGIAFRN